MTKAEALQYIMDRVENKHLCRTCKQVEDRCVCVPGWVEEIDGTPEQPHCPELTEWES